MAFVPATALWSASATLIVGSGGPLHTPFLGLFTNNFTPTYATVVGDGGLTIPTYTGYALTACTLLTAYLDSDGTFTIQGQLTEFASPADNTGQIIYGYFVMTASSSGTYLGAELFPTPFSQQETPQALVFGPQIKFSPTNQWGDVTVVSY